MKLLALNINNQKIDCPPGVPCGGQGMLPTILSVGIQVLFLIAIVLTLLYLIYGGLDWITSHGEKQKIESAKKKITFAIIGLVIVFMSYLIIRILGQAFGVDTLVF